MIAYNAEWWPHYYDGRGEQQYWMAERAFGQWEWIWPVSWLWSNTMTPRTEWKQLYDTDIDYILEKDGSYSLRCYDIIAQHYVYRHNFSPADFLKLQENSLHKDMLS